MENGIFAPQEQMFHLSQYFQLEKVSMGHGCPRLLFLFHLQLNIGYTISEQDTIYILQTEFIATLI